MADFMGMMKQAAQLQSKMQALQAELDTIEVEGTAGGGMVNVRLTAKGDLKGVRIDDSLMTPSEKKSLRICWWRRTPMRGARPRRLCRKR
jgi:hypothetical protein